MWSTSASALVPSSVTTVPLTFTWPALISSSALRREAIPAAAIIFCRRSAGMLTKLFFLGGRLRDLFRGGRVSPFLMCRVFRRNQLSLERLRHKLFELLHAGQLIDVLQPKAHQEFLGRLVKNGTPDHLLPPGGGDQLAIEQRGNHAAGIDATNLVDFRNRGRLLIRSEERRVGKECRSR